MYRVGDELHLLHCVPIKPHELLYSNPSGNLLYMPSPDLDVESDAVKHARKLLSETYCQDLELASIPYKLTVMGEEGAAYGAGIGDRVAETAEAIGAAMVVVASHRKSAFAEFFMGSIANFLVHHSPVPTLVIHAPQEDVPSHLKATGHRHIVIAVDSSDKSVRTTRWALQNVVRHGDTVHVLHVVVAAPVRPMYHSFGDGMMVSSPWVGADFESDPVRQEEIKEDLNKRFSDLFKDVDVKYQIDVISEDVSKPLESVASAICNRCHELGASALVASSGNKGLMAEFFMGSVTSYCAHHCQSPVVVLHEQNLK